MDSAHQFLFLSGALGLVAIFVGLLSARFGAPLLLVFLAIGMLAGEDGPGGIDFDDFRSAYLIGSAALAVILFEGGLKTSRSMVRLALWPALALATLGVLVTAGLVGGAIVWMLGAPWPVALLIGAAVAPTDAAAVAVLLRRIDVALPPRVTALLEVESGLNDPMSVFLTVLLTGLLLSPEGSTDAGQAALLFAEEMGGGLVLGLAGGTALLLALRHVRADAALYPVLALAGALTLFGACQSLGASGFLAVYLAGIIAGTSEHRAGPAVERFFEAFGWLAQIALFLMLGLLVTPRELVAHVPPSLAVAAVLILVARPLACFVCLLPFGFTARQTAFVSWVGLRGAVPIYLTIIPVLAGVKDGGILFGAAFTIVLISLLVQGWTVAPAARLLGTGTPATPAVEAEVAPSTRPV